MNSHSQETLRRVTQNNPSFTALTLVDDNAEGDAVFYSDNSDNYSTLGEAIATNTHLEELTVLLTNSLPLGVADREFYNGLRSNASIINLHLDCDGRNIAGVIAHEILKAYQKNGNLTLLSIALDLQNGGDRVIGDTLRSCRNLQKVELNDCNITYEQLLPIAEAVRGHRMLEVLDLYENNIGNAGCEAIAALLTDPNCNLRVVYLGNNAITAEGAITIAHSLANNNKLQRLYLGENQIDQSAQDVFSTILCNASDINKLYSSNHTLKTLNFGEQQPGQQLRSLLRLNADTNKSHVAIRKIPLSLSGY